MTREPTPELMSGQDLYYQLLVEIERHASTSQRALALHLGVSVGKLNYCLKAVIQRGWVKANNFQRADNKWAYTYLLTPYGASAKMKLARAFLASKEREFEALQREIAALRHELSKETAFENRTETAP